MYDRIDVCLIYFKHKIVVNGARYEASARFNNLQKVREEYIGGDVEEYIDEFKHD